jgi:hypothetical protein
MVFLQFKEILIFCKGVEICKNGLIFLNLVIISKNAGSQKRMISQNEKSPDGNCLI